MAVRITLKSITEELARLGVTATLARGDGYFYFVKGEADDWLDRTVRVPTLQNLTVAQWVEEFRRLKKLNADLMKKPKQPPRPRNR